MEHVRVATYEIKQGSFQEIADMAREGMLRTFQDQPGFIRYGVADLVDPTLVPAWDIPKTPTRRSPWLPAGSATMPVTGSNYGPT